MYYIYEPWASKMLHIEFIQAFLYTLLEIENEICFCGDESLINELKKDPTLEHLDYIKMKIPNYDEQGRRLYKFTQEYRNLKRIKGIIGNNGLFITNGLAQTLIFGSHLLKNNDVYIVMHGQMVALKKKFRPYNMNYYLKPALKRIPENFKLIVLGESIKKNVEQDMPLLRKQLYAIDQPHIMHIENNTDYSDYNNKHIKIGTIGVASEEKGILQLNTIQKYIRDHDITNIELFVVGKSSRHIREKLDDGIRLPFITDKLIPEELFKEEIRKLDYILYIYPQASYKYTSSGALVEAFSIGKPIISLRNDYFDYFFSKTNNDFGFIVNDITEICLLLNGLEKISKTEYQDMCNASMRALEVITPKAVSKQLRRIINRY